jgi:hypothetical protein
MNYNLKVFKLTKRVDKLLAVMQPPQKKSPGRLIPGQANPLYASQQTLKAVQPNKQGFTVPSSKITKAAIGDTKLAGGIGSKTILGS